MGYANICACISGKFLGRDPGAARKVIFRRSRYASLTPASSTLLFAERRGRREWPLRINADRVSAIWSRPVILGRAHMKIYGLLMASATRFPEFAICALDFRLRWLPPWGDEGRSWERRRRRVSMPRDYRNRKKRIEAKGTICSLFVRYRHIARYIERINRTAAIRSRDYLRRFVHKAFLASL